MGDELDLTMLERIDKAGGEGVDRREFLRRAGIAMTGLTAMVALLEGCDGNGNDQGNLLAAVVQARRKLRNLRTQAFAARNPDEAIVSGWLASLNEIMAGVWALTLVATQKGLQDSVHPKMQPFLAGLGGPLLFAGAPPAFTLALLTAATGRTEGLLGGLPLADIRGMWIFMALLALMLPLASDGDLLGLAQNAHNGDSGDTGGRIFDAFLGVGATGIGNAALFILAALAFYSIMGAHLNGRLDLLLGPQLGALLMLMLLVSFLLTAP